MNTLDPEFARALELVEEYNRKKNEPFRELRLYYRDDGSIMGLWETDHPVGNYIILDSADIVYNTNTDRMRVVDGKLTITGPVVMLHNRLVKSVTGHRVVRGHASLVLTPNETYPDIEYYDRKANS